jgi:hypothetical protein
VAVRVAVHQPPLDSTPCDRLDWTPDLSRTNSTQDHCLDVDHQATDRAGGARVWREPHRLLPVAGGSQPLQAQRLNPVQPAGERRLVLDRAGQHRRTDGTVVLRPSNATSSESRRRPRCGARGLPQQGPWPAPAATASRGRREALAAPSSGRSRLASARSVASSDGGAVAGKVSARAGLRRPAEGLAAALGWATALPLGSCLPWHPMLCRIGRPRGSNPPRTPKPQVYAYQARQPYSDRTGGGNLST